MSKVRPSKFLALIFAFCLIAFGLALPAQISVKAALTNYSPEPLVTVAQPAKGQTYTDPTFGTKILRLTDSSDASIASVAYSYWPVFNYNSTKLMIALDWDPVLYTFDPTNLTFQKVGPVFNSASQEMQWEGMTWSTTDPDTIYGISGSGTNTLLRAYNVSTKQYTFVHDFTASGELPAGGYCWQMSKSRSSDRYFSFHWWPGSGQPIKYAVVYDKQLNKTYLFDVQASYGFANFNECRLDRDGNYLAMITGQEMYIWQFATQDPSQRAVVAANSTERSGGHYELGSGMLMESDLWGSNGNRVIQRTLTSPHVWSQTFDSGVTDWTTDHHFSMIGPNDTWALVSTETNPANYTMPFTNEIFLVKTDGSGQVERLADTRTSNSTYTANPFANLSPDGQFFTFNSDWGGGHIDVYIGVLPTGLWGTTTTPPPTTGTPTASVTATPTSGTAPLAVSFASTASSPNGSITAYNWNFGDGTTGTGASVSHTYSAAGSFTATLTVTDSVSKTASANASITANSSTGGTSTTISFVNGDGKTSSATYDTSVMSAYPTYTIDTTFDGRVGGPSGAATLIAMPSIFGANSDQIPAGAQIASAKLTLSIYSSQATGMSASRILDPDNLGIWNTGAAPSDYNVGVAYGYRDARTSVMKKWSNTATSLSQVLASPDATVTLTGSEANGTKVSFDVTASVAAWAAGAPNQGWAITTTSVTSGAIFVYDSSNIASARPVLTVTYSTGSTSTTGNPTANVTATPTSGTAPLVVNFSGAGSSSPNGSITSYNWNFGDGTTGTGASVSHTYSTAGSFTATLTVTDSAGKTASASITVNPTAGGSTTGNPTANVTATPTSGTVPLVVNFSSTASSPNGSITAYNWNFGDGTTGTGASASHTYSVAGNFTATLTVTDSAGKTASASASITVTTGTPTAKVTATPTSGTAPLVVNFSSTGSSSPNGSITSYNWNFGDGTTGTGASVSHTYSTAGSFTATLTVTDSAGKTASANVSITVNPTTGGSTSSTISFVNGDGKVSSTTYDTSVLAAYPTYTINTTFDGRVGGPFTAVTLIAMPKIIGANAGQIPAGAKIVSAKLTLSIYSSQATGMRASRVLDPDRLGMWYTGASVSGYNVGVAYGYRDARLSVMKRWSNTAISLSQVLASPDATVTLTGSEANGTKVSFDVTASVAAWAAGAPNQGWAITATSVTSGAIFVYDSSNYTNMRPVLTVTYSK